MASRLISWNGGAIIVRIRAAEKAAIATTAETAAATARHDHPGWRSRTGVGEHSIQPVAPHTAGTAVLGGVGFAIRPVRFQERGFRQHPGDRAIERAAQHETHKLIDRLRAAIH
jgi:hypothetical protein